MLRHFAQNSYTCPQLEPPESPPNQASPISSFASLCSSPLKKIGTNRGLNAETGWFLQVNCLCERRKSYRNLQQAAEKVISLAQAFTPGEAEGDQFISLLQKADGKSRRDAMFIEKLEPIDLGEPIYGRTIVGCAPKGATTSQLCLPF